MDYDVVFNVGIALTAWGILIPLILLIRVRKLQKRKLYLQRELKSILKTLKESEKYKQEKERLFQDTKSKNRPSTFPVPKQRA